MAGVTVSRSHLSALFYPAPCCDGDDLITRRVRVHDRASHARWRAVVGIRLQRRLRCVCVARRV
eukprot:1242172-Prymnesium_polylepis.1